MTTEQGVDAYSTDLPINIGHGVTIQARRRNWVIGGFAWWHECSGGRREDYVNIRGVDFDDGWVLEKESPVTLSPSLLCRACGFHGFIRDGKWVPA